MDNNSYIKTDWIYDIETYPNCFTFSIIHSSGKNARCFEVSDRVNETPKILECLRYLVKNKQRMVGFNNVGFDYPVIHDILLKAKQSKEAGVEFTISYKQVYKKAMSLISNNDDDKKFSNLVKASDYFIQQVDLYKICHFDNKARATSLKMLEFNMKSDNIEDLPFPVGKTLTFDEIDVLKQYNNHDVTETLKFYKHCISQIKFRDDLSIKYGRDFTNHNDSKIGGDYFLMELEKVNPNICYTTDEYSRRKMNQTKRDEIKIKECLFDYYTFTRPEFKAVYDWFSRQIITETKGVFSDIEEHLLGDLAKYTELTTKRVKFKSEPTESDKREFLRDHPSAWFEYDELKATVDLLDENGNVVYETFLNSKGVEKQRKVKVPKKSHYGCYRIAETLNVVVDGLRYDFGTGGLHGSVQSTIVKPTDEQMMIDADVSSMYPNLFISNNVYPEHLGELFCKIYKEMYVQRKSYAKGTPENAMLKLALNGSYGNTNNEYSPFYDPKATMTITINGQLSLCLLADILLASIPSCVVKQANTDGITVLMNKEHRAIYDTVCEKWQKQVKLELEYAEYSAMYIRDVNSYLALYTNGKVKHKGAYVYDGLGWHQNHSAKIIQMAACAAMLQGKDVRDFISEHDNKYDFLLRTKVPRSSKLVLVDDLGNEVQQQNICRYYITPQGTDGCGKLVKLMTPLDGKDGWRKIGIDTDWYVKTCNNIADFNWELDYDYYVKEAEKLIIKEEM